jgi:hypothetical protein
MRRPMAAWIAGALLVMALGPDLARAQSNAGTAIGQFLLIDPGARFAAMGNAGASAPEGAQSAYYNPAAIGQLGRWEFTLTHAAWLADITYDYVAGSIPLGKWGNAFASLTALNSGEMDVRTVEQPLGTGERFSVSNVALGIGYGLMLTDRVAIGLQGNYVQERIWHSSVSTLTVSLGTLYESAANGLRIGASLSNFGTRASYEGRDLRIIYDYDPDRYGDNNTLPGERYVESYPVPQVFRVGLGWPIRLGARQRLYVAADAQHPSDNEESVSLGMEYDYHELFSLRGGYRDLFLEAAEGGLTFGAGFRYRLDPVDYRLDYAWADYGLLDAAHRITLGVSF